MHSYEAVLICPSKSIFGEVDYLYLLSDGSSLKPSALGEYQSQPVIFIQFEPLPVFVAIHERPLWYF
jgi:hypothetical protein